MLPRLCYESIPLLVSIHLPIMMQYNAIGTKYTNNSCEEITPESTWGFLHHAGYIWEYVMQVTSLYSITMQSKVIHFTWIEHHEQKQALQ